ncbi:MAG TPA: DUF5615 family PIN-like protein [Phycisphaerae bacterium]|nr:DUF5615 family PIN-like protein [Phycisphaerae bacterium]
MDHHVHAAIVQALVRAGIDVLTAQDDGFAAASDESVFSRATALNRVLFTRDEDYFAIAADRIRRGIPFVSIVYAHQKSATIGQCIEGLQYIALSAAPSDLNSVVWRLPL